MLQLETLGYSPMEEAKIYKTLLNGGKVKIEENKKHNNEQNARNLIFQIQSGDTEAETRLVDLYKGFTRWFA